MLLLFSMILICNSLSAFASQPPLYQTVQFSNVEDLIEWINNEDIENFQEGWYKNGIFSLRKRDELLAPSFMGEAQSLHSIEVLHDNMGAGRTTILYGLRSAQEEWVGVSIIEINPDKAHLLEEGLLSYWGDRDDGTVIDGVVYETTIGSGEQDPISYIILEIPQQTWNLETTKTDIGNVEDGSKVVFFIKDGFEVRVVQDWKSFNIDFIKNLHLELIPLTKHAQEWENPFTDINSSDWFYSAVETVVTNGLFSGITANTFAPYSTMTRAMFIKVIANLEGVDLSEFTISRFSDVTVDMWYAPAVEWAASIGLVSGVGNNRFAPNDNITREQMAVMLYNYIIWKGITLPANIETTSFVDEIQISSWAFEAVMSTQAAGIISGKPGNSFDPKALATRAEAAVIFARFFEIMLN